MPTANVRYGRPKGSGLDDRRQLESIAALLAANPKLKPTTAIRSLGIEDPSAIRRLRDKFRLEQAKLMADAHRAGRTPRVQSERLGSNENAPAEVTPLRPPMAAAPMHCGGAAEAGEDASAARLFSDLCELGFSAVSVAVETQCAFTQFWLGLPHVSMAARGQLTLNAIAIAICTRNKTRRQSLH